MLKYVKSLSLREPVNALTHLAGAVFSIVALTLLVVFAAGNAGAWHVVSFSIFGTTLILMYTSSTLYHALDISEKGLKIMRQIDHIMIFLLIAGTYTPICLIPLRGPWGWSIFGTAWGIAAIGIFLKIFTMDVPRWTSTLIYLIMGWICVIAIYPLMMTLDSGALLWLGLGGLSYSVGAIVYAVKKPDPFPGVFGFHEIWHLFVLFGSFCHFWVAFKYLMVIH